MMCLLKKRRIYRRWWKELEIVKILPYVRDRLAEVYYWNLGVYFEPQYSIARKISTKNLYMLSLIDDTYDIYGTLDELTLFTEAIERWNIDASEQLPSYMKIIYCGLLDVYDEFEKDLADENKSFLVNYSIIETKKVVMAYFQEAKWYYDKTKPKMEQYMKNGISTSAYVEIAATSWLGMGKEEQKRGDAPFGVECYMKEYGVTKEEAHIKIRNIIENSWKDLNEEYFKVNGAIIPRGLLMCIINLMRVVEFTYKDEDDYTFFKNNLKDVISRILIDPIIWTDDNQKRKRKN
ncbi:hypothetical protein R3W88_019064 [Solanum pinnatisectum]|uniref:Terpene synthase metal-binding domain-containing protein n=1 Tax=Solanum pinnatisectum TaxID=50273 RepID=A0AAV9KM66_9SOLN|nr:hypothetical protein R3W88_019064 [Solanum pinnatisectum]